MNLETDTDRETFMKARRPLAFPRYGETRAFASQSRP